MSELPDTNWNREPIREERHAELLGKNYSPEEMINRILDLETALYPFAYCLGSLDRKSWRGTNASSKLFPMKNDDGSYTVYKERVETSPVAISENELHSIDYFEHDSLIIDDGTKLHDLFNIMSIHQQAPGSSIGCGSVCMGDVRYAKSLIFPELTARSDGKD